MRVQVPQHVAKQGELLDGVVDAGTAIECVDNAGSAEPPPELLGHPTGCALRCRPVETIYRYPVPEALGPDGVEAHELQHALQVGHQAYHDGASDARRHGVAEVVPLRPDHVVAEPEYAHGGQGGYQGQRQVVSYRGAQAGDLRDGAHHPVAEVVVADGLAPEPGVLRLTERGLNRRVKEGEIHGLLGVVYVRVHTAVEGPADEEGDENSLADDDGAAFLPDKLDHLLSVVPGVPTRKGAHDKQKTDQGNSHAGQDVYDAKQPRQVADY